MIEEALFNRLSNFAGLVSLVSTRIYPQMMPQDPTYPAVTYSLISAPRETAMGADPGIVEARFQLSSWGAGDTPVKDMRDTAEQVRKALERWRGTAPDGTVILDTFVDNQVDMPPELVNNIKVMHRATDFKIIYRE